MLDIAPDPEKMTAYKNPDFVFGEGKGNRKIGPIAFTYNLNQLKPGKHTVSFKVKDYGSIHAAGELEIEGQDFSSYGKLLEEIKKQDLEELRMPKAGQTNKQMQETMRGLL